MVATVESYKNKDLNAIKLSSCYKQRNIGYSLLIYRKKIIPSKWRNFFAMCAVITKSIKDMNALRQMQSHVAFLFVEAKINRKRSAFDLNKNFIVVNSIAHGVRETLRQSRAVKLPMKILSYHALASFRHGQE